MDVGRPMTRATSVATIGFWLGLAGVLIALLFPYYWMLTSSLKTGVENIVSPLDLLFVPTLENYVSVLATTDVPAAIGNSLLVGGVSTLIALVLGLPAAYGIARYRLHNVGLVVLVARMVGGDQMLAPVLDPLDRSVEAHRPDADQNVLGI